LNPWSDKVPILPDGEDQAEVLGTLSPAGQIAVWTRATHLFRDFRITPHQLKNLIHAMGAK
jgi:hypothetical protein